MFPEAEPRETLRSEGNCLSRDGAEGNIEIRGKQN